MGYDISKITLNVSLGDTKKITDDMNNLIKTLESKKIKLEVDTSSLKSNITAATSEIEKAYSKVRETVKKTNDEISKPIKISNSGISEIEKQISSAEKAISKFTETKNRQLNNILSGSNGNMAINLTEYSTLVTKMNELKNLKLDSNNVTTYTQHIKDVQVAYDALNTKIRQVNSTSKEMNSSAKIDSDVINKVRNYNTQLEIMAQNNSNITSNPLYQQISNDINKLSQATQPLSQLSNETNIIDNNMKKLKSSMAQVGDMGGVFTRLGQSVKSAFSFMSASTIMYQFANKIREIPSAVKEVDTAFVELQKVSDVTADKFDSVINNAYEKGIKLSATLTDYMGAEAAINRGGYSSESDVDTLSKLSLVMKNVSENMKNTDENASALIATMKGFNGEVTDAEHYVNAYNNVSNNMSVTFDQLVKGVEKASAVLNIYKNSFDKTIAMITGGTEIFGGDSERVANGLKSVAMNLAAIDEETGEFNPEYFAKMKDTLEDVAGIDITETNGELKGTFDILKDLAEVYPTLSKNQQLYITQLIGKKTQSTVLAAILQNWEAVEKAQELAINSAGSYMDEQGKYYQSIQGHVDRLTSSFQMLAVTTLDSGIVKQVLSLTTGIIDLTTACGGLAPILTSILGIIILIKSQAIAATVSSVVGSLTKLGSVVGLVATGYMDLGGAMAALNINPAVAGFTALVAVLGAVKIAMDKAKQKHEEYINTITERANSTKTEIENLDELSSRYKELYDTTDRTSDQKKELLDVQNQLIESLGLEKGAIDATKDSWEKVADKINTAKDAKLDYLISDQKEILNEAKDEYDKFVGKDVAGYDSFYAVLEGYGKDTKGIENTQELITALRELKIEFQDKGMDKGVFFDKFSESLSELESKFKDVENANNNLFESMAAKDIQKISKTLDIEDVSNLTEEQATRIKEAFSNMFTYIGKTQNSDYIQFFYDMIDGAIENKDVIDELTGSVQRLGITSEGVEKLAESYGALSKTSNDLQSMIDKIKESKGVTQEVIDNIAENHPDLVKYLGDEIELREKIQDKLEDVKDTQLSTMRSMISAESEYYNEANAQSEEYYREKILGNENTCNEIQNELKQYYDNLGVAYDIDLENYKTIQQLKGKVTEDLINKLSKAWSEYFGKMSQAFSEMSAASSNIEKQMALRPNSWIAAKGINDGISNGIADMRDEIKRKSQGVNAVADKEITNITNKMNQLANIFGKYTFDPVSIDVGGGGTKAAKKSGKGSSSEKYASYIDSLYDSILKSLEEGTDKVDRQIAISQSKLQHIELFGTNEEEVEANKALEELYQKRIDIMKNKSSNIVSLRDKMAKELSSKGYSELKGLDLTQITELQLDKVVANLEKQIDSANTSNNSKLKASLTYKKDLIEDYCKNIITANKDINSMAKDIIDAQNDLGDVVIDNINKTLNHTISKIDSEMADIDLEKSLLVTDGMSDTAKADLEKMFSLNSKYLSDIVAKQKATEDAIQALRKQGVKEESEAIQTLINEWEDYEKARTAQIREIAMARRKYHIDSINNELDGINEGKSNIKSLYDLTLDMLKQEINTKKDTLKEQYDDRKNHLDEVYNAEKDALNKRLSLLKEEADARKKALREESDERSYQQELSEKQKLVADTQAKITELGNDDSYTGIKKRKSLEDQLSKYKKDLEDFQYDHSIEIQEKAIDEQLELEEKKIQDQLDALEDKYNRDTEMAEESYNKQLKEYEDMLKDQTKLKEQANKLIESKDKAFYDRLKDYALNYTDMLSVEMDNLWNEAYDAMDKYGSGCDNVNSILEKMTQTAIELNKELKDVQNNTTYKDYIEDDPSTSDDDYEVKKPSSSSSNDKYGGLNNKDERAEYRDKQLKKLIAIGDNMKVTKDPNTIRGLRDQQAQIASTIGAYLQNGAYYIMINGKKYPVRNAIGVRHDGLKSGRVGDSLMPNERIMKLTKDEWVFTGKQYSNLSKNIDNMLSANSSTNENNNAYSISVDIHDFSIKDEDMYKKFSKFMKQEVPVILDKHLFKKGIK